MTEQNETQHCQSTNARGERCASPPTLVVGGYCQAHRVGGREHLRKIAEIGGEANRAKLASAGFTAADLTPVVSLEDAKLALDAIRVAVLTRRITHAEGNAASKVVAEWVKTEAAGQTHRLMNDMRQALDEKSAEIRVLRKQLAGGVGASRLVPVTQ